jgi:hypothetical protein
MSGGAGGSAGGQVDALAAGGDAKRARASDLPSAAVTGFEAAFAAAFAAPAPVAQPSRGGGVTAGKSYKPEPPKRPLVVEADGGAGGSSGGRHGDRHAHGHSSAASGAAAGGAVGEDVERVEVTGGHGTTRLRPVYVPPRQVGRHVKVPAGRRPALPASKLTIRGRMKLVELLEHVAEVHNASTSRALALWALEADDAARSAEFAALTRFLGGDNRVGVVEAGEDVAVYIIPPAASLLNPAPLVSAAPDTGGHILAAQYGLADAPTRAWALLRYKPASYRRWVAVGGGAAAAPTVKRPTEADVAAIVAAARTPPGSPRDGSATPTTPSSVIQPSPMPDGATPMGAAEGAGGDSGVLDDLFGAVGGGDTPAVAPAFAPAAIAVPKAPIDALDPALAEVMRETATMIAEAGADGLLQLQATAATADFNGISLSFLLPTDPRYPILLSLLPAEVAAAAPRPAQAAGAPSPTPTPTPTPPASAPAAGWMPYNPFGAAAGAPALAPPPPPYAFPLGPTQPPPAAVHGYAPPPGLSHTSSRFGPPPPLPSAVAAGAGTTDVRDTVPPSFRVWLRDHPTLRWDGHRCPLCGVPNSDAGSHGVRDCPTNRALKAAGVWVPQFHTGATWEDTVRDDALAAAAARARR